MRTRFTGVGTALITPFRKDGSLDEPAVKRLVRRQLDAGIHFVSPCGTTGEAPTLSHREKLRVVELVMEEAKGRVPVLAGAGGYDTRAVIALPHNMERAGAGGVPRRAVDGDVGRAAGARGAAAGRGGDRLVSRAGRAGFARTR